MKKKKEIPGGTRECGQDQEKQVDQDFPRSPPLSFLDVSEETFFGEHFPFSPNQPTNQPTPPQKKIIDSPNLASGAKQTAKFSLSVGEENGKKVFEGFVFENTPKVVSEEVIEENRIPQKEKNHHTTFYYELVKDSFYNEYPNELPV